MDHSDKIIDRVYKLMSAYKSGALGGETMPEDENPGLHKASKENYMYFTLPMALNYQRNTYVLWECANRMYQDIDARMVFDSSMVCKMKEDDLRDCLVKYKVALQQNKQPVIWKTLCNTIEDNMAGDIRNLFQYNGYSVKEIIKYIKDNKKSFPYLGGDKICNYWLYVLEQYTDIKFADRENISVAPDTHVIQASEKLGIITASEAVQADIQLIVTNRWKELLSQTEFVPIDLHTPMWLWSRGKFSICI
jgi:hypothetical protein